MAKQWHFLIYKKQYQAIPKKPPKYKRFTRTYFLILGNVQGNYYYSNSKPTSIGSPHITFIYMSRWEWKFDCKNLFCCLFHLTYTFLMHFCKSTCSWVGSRNSFSFPAAHMIFIADSLRPFTTTIYILAFCLTQHNFSFHVFSLQTAVVIVSYTKISFFVDNNHSACSIRSFSYYADLCDVNGILISNWNDIYPVNLQEIHSLEHVQLTIGISNKHYRDLYQLLISTEQYFDSK